MIACLLSFAMLLSIFHASAYESDTPQPSSEVSLTAEHSQSAPQSSPQHQVADHCLFHLLGDIAHPADVATIQHVSVKPNWREDIPRTIAALDSPFKPPRA